MSLEIIEDPIVTKERKKKKNEAIDGGVITEKEVSENIVEDENFEENPEDREIEKLNNEIDQEVKNIEEINSVVLRDEEKDLQGMFSRFFDRAREIKREVKELISEVQEDIAIRKKEKKLESIYKRVRETDVTLDSLKEIYSGIGSDKLETPRRIQEFITQRVVRPHLKEELEKNHLQKALEWYEFSKQTDGESNGKLIEFFSSETLKKNSRATPKDAYETGVSLLKDNPRMLMRFLDHTYRYRNSLVYEKDQEETIKRDIANLAEENKENLGVLEETSAFIFAFDDLVSPKLKRNYLVQNGVLPGQDGVFFVNTWKEISPKDRMDVIKKTSKRINVNNSDSLTEVRDILGYAELNEKEFFALLKGVNYGRKWRRITVNDIKRDPHTALLTNNRVLKCSPDEENSVIETLFGNTRFNFIEKTPSTHSDIAQKRDVLYLLQTMKARGLSEQNISAVASGMVRNNQNFFASFCLSDFFTSEVRENIINKILENTQGSVNGSPAIFDELFEKAKSNPDKHIQNMGEQLLYKFGSKEALRHHLSDVIRGTECVDMDKLVAAYTKKEGSWELVPEFIEMFIERDLLDIKYAPEFLKQMKIDNVSVLAEKLEGLKGRNLDKYNKILSIAEDAGSGSVLAMGLKAKFFDSSQEIVDRIIDGSQKEEKGYMGELGILSLIDTGVIPLDMAVDNVLEKRRLNFLGKILEVRNLSSDDIERIFNKTKEKRNIDTLLFIFNHTGRFLDSINKTNFIKETEDMAIEWKSTELTLSLLREKNNSQLKLSQDFFERVIHFGTEINASGFIVDLLEINAKEFNPSKEALGDLFSSLEKENKKDTIIKFIKLYFTDIARYGFLDVNNKVQTLFEKTVNASAYLSKGFLDDFLDPSDGWYKTFYKEGENIPPEVFNALLSSALHNDEVSKKFYEYDQCAAYFKSVLEGEESKNRKTYLIRNGINRADPLWMLGKNILTPETFITALEHSKKEGVTFSVKNIFDVNHPHVIKFRADLLEKFSEQLPDEIRYDLQKTLHKGREVNKLFANISNYEESRMKHVAAGEFIGSLFAQGKTDQEMLSSFGRQEKENFEAVQLFIDAHRGDKSDFGLTIVALIGAREYNSEMTLGEYLEKILSSLRTYEKFISSWDSKKIPEDIRASIGMEYEVTTSTGVAYKQISNREIKNDFIEFNEFARIGRGNDGEYEIATQVADNPYLILAQMHLLQELDFIDLNFKKEGYERGARGMHLTIGGASGVRNTANSNFLHNLLIMSNWGGVNAGKDIKGASRGRPYVMRSRQGVGGSDFWSKNESIEMRSLSIDKWEPFERTVSTAYCGAIAIQAVEKYTKIDPLSFEFEPDVFPENEKELYEILKKRDLLNINVNIKDEFDAHIWEPIYAWVRMIHDAKKAVKKHNEEFLERETYGYLDEKGVWIDAKDFGGGENRKRFEDVAKTSGYEKVDEYMENLKITENDLFSQVTPDLINACTGVANLYLKPSKESGGDVVNAAAMLSVTKLGDKIEDDSFSAVEESPFNRRKIRRGYYSLQGASKEMIIHAVQRSLLIFQGRMEQIFAFQ